MQAFKTVIQTLVSSLRYPLPLGLAMGLALPAAATSTPPIFDGEPAKTCEWPNTVHFVGVCSGTLVHPRVVLFAAHCKLSKEAVMFGENARRAHGKTVKAKYCHKNPKFKDFAQGEDYAYCLLEEPVEDVPIAPIAYGCELDEVKADAEIWLVGFGTIKDKSAGTKHKGKSKIRKLTANNTEILVGGDDVATTCYGDSGGPAFIQLSDGTWRTIGIVSYGTNRSCEYPSGLTLANVAVPWIHKDLKANGVDDIDLLPCYDEDGTWNPSDACTRFPLDHGHSTADWGSMCSEGAKLSGPSTICAPKDKLPPTLTWTKLDKDTELSEGEVLNVEIEAKDNATIDPAVTLWVNDQELDTLKNPPYQWTLKDLEAGELKLKARAVDAAGNQAEVELDLSVQEKEEEPKGTDSNGETTGEDSQSEDSQSGDSTESDSDDSAEDGEETQGSQESEGPDESEDPEQKPGQDESNPPRRSGCALHETPAPESFIALSLLAWGIGRRRRAAVTPGTTDNALVTQGMQRKNKEVT